MRQVGVARRWRKEGREVFAWDLVNGVEIAVVDEGEKSRPHPPPAKSAAASKWG